MRQTTKKIALCGLLIALSAALSYMEAFLPLTLLIPLPGLKLGLANIVSLVSLYLLGFIPTLCIVVLRCFLVALFSGSFSALFFSLTGGILAVLVMALLARHPAHFSIFGVSIAGAAAHNTGQIIASCIVLSSINTIFYLPVLLIASLVTGALTAVVASLLLKVLPPSLVK